MVKKQLRYILAGGILLLFVGCERIHEPWVSSPEQLAQERSRPDAAQVELRHRLLEVQTDR